ncbi:MAG: hypothetical protein AAGA18_15920 [Verrucomicrobiota bacterium]
MMQKLFVKSNYQMKSTNHPRQNIERLAILNAWITSSVVLLNLLLSLIVFNIPKLKVISPMMFVAGTVGGAASNYRRLQEAYVQQLRNSVDENSVQALDLSSEHISQDQLDAVSIKETNETAITLEVDTSESDTQNISLIEASPMDESPMKDEATYFILKLQIFLSPIFGGLFAFVLYGIFASGIIQGELFPNFKSAEEEFITPYEYSSNTLPATNADFSKAILWAFIAGFTEGFVPNFIDKLVKDNE